MKLNSFFRYREGRSAENRSLTVAAPIKSFEFFPKINKNEQFVAVCGIIIASLDDLSNCQKVHVMATVVKEIKILFLLVFVLFFFSGTIETLSAKQSEVPKPTETPKPAEKPAPAPKPAETPKPAEKKDDAKDVYKPYLRIVPVRALAQSDKDIIQSMVFSSIESKPPVVPKKPRKLLIFDLNVDFEGHRSIVCANYMFECLAERTKAFEVVVAHEKQAFQADHLKQFDAVVFNNTVGNVFSDPELRKNLENFVRNGGGLLGIHAATETFVHYGGDGIGKDDWPIFAEMLGARGTKHRETDEKVFVSVEDPQHPLTQIFPKNGFSINDEILRFENPYSRKNLRVLLSLDKAKSNLKRPPFGDQKERADEDYALLWVKTFGKGRCCYCAFGHNPRIFWDPTMIRFYFAATQFVLGDLDASTVPSIPPAKPAEVPKPTDKPVPEFKPVETPKPTNKPAPAPKPADKPVPESKPVETPKPADKPALAPK